MLDLDAIDSLVPGPANWEHREDSLHSSYNIQDSAAGLWHVTNVLSMLVDICMESTTSHYATSAFNDYMAWLLDAFLISRGLLKKLQTTSTFSEACKRSESMALCAVQALLSTLRPSLTQSMRRKGCELLSVLVGDLLQDISSSWEESMSYNFCSSLLTLAAGCKQHESTRRSIALHLAPSIHLALSDETTAHTLGRDFQVRIIISFSLPCSNFCYRCLR